MENFSTRPQWTLLSNHGHVLVCIHRTPDVRLKDVALQVGITERAVQKIVSELVAVGYIEISKAGRCNTYRISPDSKLRHPLEAETSVGDFLSLLA